MSNHIKPTPEQLAAAVDKLVPDVIAPQLKVLFCGINPSLYSAATGTHFARPGNRFWPALHAAGLTPEQLRPDQQQELLTYRLGVTNLVRRATRTAAELSAEELLTGAEQLTQLVAKYQPQRIAFLGITAYRTAFSLPKAQLGQQAQRIADAEVWALPNPSGLNAHYQLADLAACYRQLTETTA